MFIVMQKRSSRKKTQDANLLATQIVEEATQEEAKNASPSETIPEGEAKNPHAQALGRLGGLKGGKARAARLTAKRRKEIAQKAAKARWKDND